MVYCRSDSVKEIHLYCRQKLEWSVIDAATCAQVQVYWKFKESVIVIQTVQTLYPSANILHNKMYKLKLNLSVI